MSDFPRMIYQDGGGNTVVYSEAEMRELIDSGQGWSITPGPAHFRPSEHHSLRVEDKPEAVQSMSAEDRLLERFMEAARKEFAPLTERRGPGRPRKDEE